MFILVQTKESIYTIDLSKTISGCFQINYKDKIIADVRAYRNKWKLQAKEDMFINQKETACFIKEDDVYVVGNNTDIKVMLYVKNATYYVYKKYVCNSNFSIGRNKDCDIVYNNPFVSNVHAVVKYNMGKFFIQDAQSTNYTYVNGNRCDEGYLTIGDVITIMGLKIILGINFWLICDIEKNNIKFSASFYPYKTNETIPIPKLKEYEMPTIRIAPIFQASKITVKDPLVNESIQDLPLWLKLGPSLCMGIIAISNIVFSIQRIDSTSITNILPSMFMSVSMLLTACLFPLLTHRFHQRRHKRLLLLNEQEYQHYLNDIQKQIDKEKEQEKQYLLYTFPDLDELLFSKSYGYISKQDYSYLKMRIGIGSTLSSIEINNSCKFSLMINDVPIFIDITKHFLIGIKGIEKEINDFLKQILVLSCFNHTPQDLSVICIGKSIPSSLRWLPHLKVFNMHCFITDEDSATEFQEALYAKIQEEKKCSNLLIVLFDDTFNTCIPILQQIKNNEYMGITLITCNSYVDKYSHIFIDIEKQTYQFRDEVISNKIVFDNSSNTKQAIRFLANIPRNDNSSALPAMYPFLSMFEVQNIEELNVWKRWEQHLSYKTLKTPIGLHQSGQLLMLDIHEKCHGPHGLLAGMTGSGKSECILTYLLSMAINYHPRDVQFLIIDYKGGGLAKLLESLPHTNGIITNLEDNLLERIFISLHAEIIKRQKLLKEAAMKYQIANLSINEYQRLYYEQRVSVSLAHLIIICDEFAELKSQQPMYMDQLISTARIGRSLGIHLILATQKPSGIVNDQIWSNTHFHLCMKVADKSDSMDMLHCPDSAYLQNSGQFYLQIGNNEAFMKGQCAWAQAPYMNTSEKYINQSLKVMSLKRDIQCERSLFDLINIRHETQFEAVVKHLVQCAKLKKIVSKPTWMPPITQSKRLDELLTEYEYQEGYALIGELDEPKKQCYRGFYIPLRSNSIVYAQKDQKHFLEIFLNSITQEKCKNKVQCYCIDMHQDVSINKQNNSICFIKQDEEEKLVLLFNNLNQQSTKNDALTYIVLHGYALFEKVYQKHVEAFQSLLKEGTNKNIYFLISAQHEDEISYRIRPYFTNVLALYMERKEELVSILNCQIKQNATYQKGRGYFYDHQLYEFHIAYI